MNYAIVSTCGYIETAHVSRMIWLPCHGVVNTEPVSALRDLAMSLLKAYHSARTEWSSDSPTFDEYDFLSFIVDVCNSTSVDCQFSYDDESYDIYGSTTDLLDFPKEYVIDIPEKFEHVMVMVLTPDDVSTVFTTETAGDFQMLNGLSGVDVKRSEGETWRVEIS